MKGKKRSTAKKSTAKKSTAKKSTAKKSTAKKSTAKKSTAKKSTAKPRVLLGRPIEDTKKTPHRTGEPDVRRVYVGDAFPGCKNLPVHLATVQLDAIPGLPESVRALGALPIVYSNCESCDAWMLDGDEFSESMSFRLDEEGRLVPAKPESYRLACLEGSTARQPTRVQGIELVPLESVPEEDRDRYPIRVGGEPEWLQSEGFCVCPECECAMSDFVAQVSAYRLPPGAGCGDQTLYVFVCPDCRTTGMVSQCT